MKKVAKIINLAFAVLLFSGPSLAENRISGIEAEQIILQGEIIAMNTESRSGSISRYYTVSLNDRLYSCWEYFRIGDGVSWLCWLADPNFWD